MAELTARDWMVIVGALLILAVLLDAWRRVYQDRRAPVRMKLASGSGEAEDGEETGARSRDIDLAWLRELPNGGARVVERGADDEGPEPETPAAPAPEPRPAPVLRRPVEDKPVRRAAPEPAVEAPPAAPAKPPSPEPPASPARAADNRRDTPPPKKPGPAPRKPAAPEDEVEPARVEPDRDEPDRVELVSGMSGADEPENLDWLDALEAEQKRSREEGNSRVTAQLPRDVQPEVFMLNVVARNSGGFRGEDIMHILLACDLRFGDMNFFHRHEQEAGRGPIQFSVANMMQPGVFDIDNMADFTTPGLVFFVTLPGPEDMMKAFDYMLETAQVVARNLEGDVLDETRSVLTRQTLEHNRQQIRDLERRLLAKAR